MNNKHRKGNNQLSLTFEASGKAAEATRAGRIEQRSSGATVIAFPSPKPSAPSFRERVIQDLMRNRIMVD